MSPSHGGQLNSLFTPCKKSLYELSGPTTPCHATVIVLAKTSPVELIARIYWRVHKIRGRQEAI